MDSRLSPNELDLKSVRGPLLSINQTLKRMCSHALEIVLYTEIHPGGKMSLYDESSTPDFVLCLNETMHEKRCISSISCKINDDWTVDFSSKTDPVFEGRKYNLFLRAVLCILTPHIKITRNGIHHRLGNLISRAIHPVSIYLLVKYFHAKNDRMDEYMEQNQLSYSTITLDDVRDFYDNMDEDMMEEDDGEEYMMMNEDFGSPIVFILDVHDAAVQAQARHIFQTTRIRCPDPVFRRTVPKSNATRKMTPNTPRKSNKRPAEQRLRTSKSRKRTRGDTRPSPIR